MDPSALKPASQDDTTPRAGKLSINNPSRSPLCTLSAAVTSATLDSRGLPVLNSRSVKNFQSNFSARRKNFVLVCGTDPFQILFGLGKTRNATGAFRSKITAPATS
jgi:hypothetical protein